MRKVESDPIPWQTLHEPLRRVLRCLDVENRRLSTYFEAVPGMPLVDALHEHLQRLHGDAAGDATFGRIVAAGLLALGELERVDEILESSPVKGSRLDHGAGWCGTIANATIAAVLPLPGESPESATWLAGSEELAWIRVWIAENRDRLFWDTGRQRFCFG